jgi:hypothetical protein
LPLACRQSLQESRAPPAELVAEDRGLPAGPSSRLRDIGAASARASPSWRVKRA